VGERYRGACHPFRIVRGNLYHIWHGDIASREYLKRIQDFAPLSKGISRRDENGLFESDNPEIKLYIGQYFKRREVSSAADTTSDGFLDDPLLGGLLGGDFMGGYVGADLRDVENDAGSQERHEQRSENFS
jgi:hypothetical protein